MYLFLFFLFLFIKSIKTALKAEIINPYVEKNFQLINSDSSKIYNFYPRTIDLNHEIIIQINSSYNGNAYLCTGYFKNKAEENIYYNYRSNNYINCQKSYNINTISYIEEYNITYDFFNSTNSPNINGYYLIILYLDKTNIKEFSGTITSFIPNMNVPIESNALPKYFYYKNNYSLKNYSFTIYPNYKQIKNNLNIQILSLDNKNIFNINITNKDNYIIDKKSNIFSYNNFFNISNEENTFYLLNILFNENNSEINNFDFAIYIEYSSVNFNLMPLTDDVNEINFLVKSDYYFYLNLSYIYNNGKLFFVAYDLSLKRGAISLSSLEANIELGNLNNNTYLQKYIYLSNFANCKSRFYWNSISSFKCLNSIHLNNNSNIIIIKISSSGINSLKVRKIHFKELKRIILDDNEYKNGLYYKSFNSDFLIDKFGYFYLPKINNDTKRQLIYCSNENTMTLYYGDYDIIDQNQDILNFDKLRLFKISHDNKDYMENNFDGFTIFTYNKDYNYFIQLIDVNIDIYDNLIIEKLVDKDHLNKEIIFDAPIKNYYIFCMNDFNEDNQDIIFDIQILYGNIDAKYIDIDSIQEKDFNLNKIILFNDEDYSIKNLNHPILVKQTTEFIKIINNRFNFQYFYKTKFYLNKYIIKENNNWNELNPIFLNPYESKIFSLEQIYGDIKCLFKLGDNYKDYTNNNNNDLVSIIVGNNKINNVYNLSNQNNLIIGNQTYIYFGDTIKFINNFNKSILIWSNLLIFHNIENIISLYLSNNYYYLYTFSNVHKLCFDWFNIKKKIEYGLIPQKIFISLLNEKQTKTNGYYYQELNIDDDNNDYIYYHSYINSIPYELEQGESHIFLSEDINITEYDFYYKNNSYINYMIYPSSGLSTIFFYVEYLYDITNYVNKLKFLECDNSVYSLNLKMDNSYIEKRHLYNNYNYLVFQCLSCRSFLSKVNFKYKNNSYSLDDNNENNINLKSISSGNFIGYINFKFFNKYTINDELYINIIKPYITYIKYFYTTNIEENYIFPNNYNINVEKEPNMDNKKDTFIISFDCFLKNKKTNYTILILNKTEIKNEISNECQFFFYLEKRNNITIDIKQLNFIDNNENIRIKKEISFNKFGNYAIYILAQTLDEFSIFKFLGSESYSYTNNFNNKSNNNVKSEKEKENPEIIAILLFILLLIILIFLFILYRYIRKKKLNDLFNSINNSLISNNLYKSSQNKIIEFDNIDNINNENEINNEIDNKNSINDDDNNFNILLFEKPKEEKEDNKYKNNKNNNIDSNLNIDKDKDNKDNKDLELDPGLLGQSPAPLLGNTFCSEEDVIKNELAKINDSSNYSKNNDEEKKFINTNKGL